MKKFISITLVVIALVSSASAIISTVRYERYVSASQELLWDLEEICESHDIDWGDTICEGDSWANYCEARECLGKGYLQHYSKRSE